VASGHLWVQHCIRLVRKLACQRCVHVKKLRVRMHAGRVLLCGYIVPIRYCTSTATVVQVWVCKPRTSYMVSQSHQTLLLHHNFSKDTRVGSSPQQTHMPCVTSPRSGPAQARLNAAPCTNMNIALVACISTNQAPHTLHLRTQNIPESILAVRERRGKTCMPTQCVQDRRATTVSGDGLRIHPMRGTRR
jgi:hypothetical protein